MLHLAPADGEAGIATSTQGLRTVAVRPTAFPYPLVDRIVAIDPGVRAMGTKLLSANEPYFAGHFPGAPVFPGVLICEALAQLAAQLTDDAGVPLRLTRVDRARFRRPLLPGDVLALEVTREGAPAGRLRGRVSSGEVLVADVEFTLAEPTGGWIHPTAQIAPTAVLARGVRVGAYATIGPHVTVGPDAWIGPHAVLDGHTTLGARTRVFSFAAVGVAPQDIKYRGEASTLTIGDDTVIREHASLHPGTAPGGMRTIVGAGCLLMGGSHVAHDCLVGDGVILANGAALGGHVTVGDHAIVGGLAGVHQFVRVGESALCAAGAMVSKDVAPFCIAAGDRARLFGLNHVGLRRRGLPAETRAAIKRAVRDLFSRGSWRENLPGVRARAGHVPEVERLLAFVEATQRGLCR